MNATRLVTLAAALVITATEWAAFSSLPLYTHSLPAAAPATSAAPEEVFPVIVVTAHRQS
jgi:hypothetical protein